MDIEKRLKDTEIALHNACCELQAIKFFEEGQKPSFSHGICGRTTVGYGKLHDLGYWQYELPVWYVELKGLV